MSLVQRGSQLERQAGGRDRVTASYRGVGHVAPELGQLDAARSEAIATLRSEAGDADSEGDPAGAAALRRAADVLAGRGGAVLAGSAADNVLDVRCFGVYEVSRDGTQVPVSPLRPRARSLLRLLSMYVGRPVHREVLLTALWPDVDPEVATRSMQTSLSSVRRVLHEAVGEDGLVREGHSYGLRDTLFRTDTDVALGRLRAASRLRTSDPRAAAACWVDVLDLYTGDLLSEEGPAEWVVGPREEWRRRAVQAAHGLASWQYASADEQAAVRTARRGLEIDRYDDGLWRLLIDGLRANGDQAAADVSVREYASMLASP